MTNPAVLANIRYLLPSGVKPVYFASRGGANAALAIEAKFQDHEIKIHIDQNFRYGQGRARPAFGSHGLFQPADTAGCASSREH